MANEMEMEMEMAKPQLGSAQKDPSDPPSSPHPHAETSIGPPLPAPSDRPKPPCEDQPAEPRSRNKLGPHPETSVDPPPLTSPSDCPKLPPEDQPAEPKPKSGNKLDPHAETSPDPPLTMPSDCPKRPREDEPADAEPKNGNEEEIEREESGVALKKKICLDTPPKSAENAVAKDEMLLNPEVKSSFDEELKEKHEETSEDVVADPGKKSEKKKKKPRVEVKLGPKTFENSMEMYDFFADFVHGWSLNINANKYEHLVLMDLLKKGCPDPSAKIGTGVKAFQVRIHPEFDNRCFYIIRNDGSMEDFSFRKCVDNLMGLPPRQRSGGNKQHSKNNGYGGRGGHHGNKPNKFGGRGGHHGRNFGGRGGHGQGGHGGHRW